MSLILWISLVAQTVLSGVPQNAGSFGGHCYEAWGDTPNFQGALEKTKDRVCCSKKGRVVYVSDAQGLSISFILYHLVENLFVHTLVAPDAFFWVSVTDEAQEGVWVVADGPEKGLSLHDHKHDLAGQPVVYQPWNNVSGTEPNGGAGENGVLSLKGLWLDWRLGNAAGLIIEYDCDGLCATSSSQGCCMLVNVLMLLTFQ
jgi:hypothetical protein